MLKESVVRLQQVVGTTAAQAIEQPMVPHAEANTHIAYSKSPGHAQQLPAGDAKPKNGRPSKMILN